MSALSQDLYVAVGVPISAIGSGGAQSLQQNGTGTLSSLTVSTMTAGVANADTFVTLPGQNVVFTGSTLAAFVTGGAFEPLPGGAPSYINQFNNITSHHMSTLDMNVSSLNGALYPYPTTVTPINGLISTLAVSSFVTANSMSVSSISGLSSITSIVPIVLNDPISITLNTPSTIVTGQLRVDNISTGALQVSSISSSTNVFRIDANGLTTPGIFWSRDLETSSLTTFAPSRISSLLTDSISTPIIKLGKEGYMYEQGSDLWISTAYDIVIKANNMDFGQTSIGLRAGTQDALVLNAPTGGSINVTAPLFTAKGASISSITVSSVNGSTDFMYKPNAVFSTVTAVGLSTTSISTASVSLVDNTLVTPGPGGNIYQAGNNIHLSTPQSVIIEAVNMRFGDAGATLRSADLSTGDNFVVSATSSVRISTPMLYLETANISTLLTSSFSISTLSVGDFNVSSLNFPSSCSMALNSGGDFVFNNGGGGDTVLNSQLGIAVVSGVNGVQVSSSVPSGSNIYISGTNWSTLVAVVKGLSSFS